MGGSVQRNDFADLAVLDYNQSSALGFNSDPLEQPSKPQFKLVSRGDPAVYTDKAEGHGTQSKARVRDAGG